MASEFANALSSVSSEHMTSRKASRLKFMQTETEQQLYYIKDLETSLALNKSMLQELFHTPTAHVDDTQSLTFTSHRIIEQLINDNRRLEDQLAKSMNLRNEAQVKALINEQILTECYIREQELTEELEEKLQELKYQAERRNRLIQEYTQRNQLLESEAEIYKKSKDTVILSPIEPVMRLHEKTERLRMYLHKIARELHKIRVHNQALVEECRILWSDYNKVVAVLKNPVNRRISAPQHRELSFSQI